MRYRREGCNRNCGTGKGEVTVVIGVIDVPDAGPKEARRYFPELLTYTTWTDFGS